MVKPENFDPRRLRRAADHRTGRGSLVVTQANEYTIIRQFGAVVRIIDQPGLSLKTPFVQSASTLPKTEMLYDLAVSDVITSDKKSMVADSFVLWRIDDPAQIHPDAVRQRRHGGVPPRSGRLQQPEKPSSAP